MSNGFARISRHGITLAVAGALLTAAVAFGLVRHSGLRALDVELADRLSITRHAATAEVERFRYLPAVLGQDARVLDLLAGRGTVAPVNDYLAVLRDLSGVDALYVLNRQGTTLAASNWNTPESFVGMNYAFRPYFNQSLATGEGRHYAVGVTTGKPGYFLAARIGPAHAPLGVAVAKVDLTPLEAAWQAANEAVGIADAFGVVFLAGHPDWRYRPIRSLSEGARGLLARERRYAGLDLSDTPPLLAESDRSETGTGLRFRELPLEPDGWRVIAAAPTLPVTARALLVATTALLLAGLAAGALLFQRQRGEMLRMQREQNDLLERRVAERTDALAREIEVRRRAEEELRTTHATLVHTAKLAVLGRMSSTIVHEVSQPLSALDSTLAAAELHLRATDTAKAGRSLTSARELLHRMQQMLRSLKRFGARQKPEPAGPVPLGPALEAAGEILAPRLRDLGLAMTVTLQDMPPVAGNPSQLQQVLTNLILNAAEATARNRSTAPVEVLAGPQGDPGAGRLRIEIRDRGTGIPEDLHETVFEPFFTTRVAGEGLGLGLSIVRTILDHMGASVRFVQREGGGTTALLDLPTFPAGGRM